MGIQRRLCLLLQHQRKLMFLLILPLLLVQPISISKANLLSKSDIKHYQKAFDAMDKKNWDRAFRHARNAKDPLPLDAIKWSYYRYDKTKASFTEITDFIKEHPEWPRLWDLHHRAEQTITASTPEKLLLSWFKDHAPYSTRGLFHYAKALVNNEQTAKAKELVRDAWRNNKMASVDENALRKRYKKWLSKDDHLARLEFLLWEGSTSAAKRQARRVSKDMQRLAEARINLRKRAAGVDWSIRQVPKELIDHPGLVYERLRWRVRKRRYEDSIPLLNKPQQEKEFASLWWKERGRIARWALKEGRVSQAYDLASNHAAEAGYAFADAEWLSGWIALRYLQEPKTALSHFQRMEKKVSFPVSLSRAAYWIGRAQEELGNAIEAQDAYLRSARFPHRFYGQLAAAKLPKNLRSTLPSAPMMLTSPTREIPTKPEKQNLAKLIVMLSEVEADSFVKTFIRSMTQKSTEKDEYQFVAALSREIGRNDLAVYAARQADKKHILLSDMGYPIYPITDKNFLQSPIIQSIIRQESGFLLNAKSRAGALGMMQLMPSTAKRVAKDEKISYNKKRLTTDPFYNITLGQSYLSGLINRFDGSLPMAFAGYNAGPSRVRKWVKQNGDPTESIEEMIDWIENIPFDETRNYVQRVSENLIIYRQKLNQTENSNHLTLEGLTLLQSGQQLSN